MKVSLSVILQYIGSYYRRTFRPLYFLIVIVLLAAIIFFNYQRGSFFREFITGKAMLPPAIASYALYFIPFAIAFLLQALFYRQVNFLKNKSLWLLILVAPAIFAWRVHLNLDQPFFKDSWQGDTGMYWYRCFSWLAKSLFAILAIYLFWLLKDRRQQPFYGSVASTGSLRPYLILLLMMLPFIALAATRPDFLNMYPRAQLLDGLELSHKGLRYFFYELCYGFDFISIELFFRGFLVIAFMRICGMYAIVPAAVFYCCIHLDKPMAEAISSFWGGMLLGIIAYHTKSIRGGIMIHLGIAWLMEIAGFIGRAHF